MKDDLAYIGHMLDMARKARAFVAGIKRTDYDNDEKLALAHLMQVVSEAARHVSPEFQAAHSVLS